MSTGFSFSLLYGQSALAHVNAWEWEKENTNPNLQANPNWNSMSYLSVDRSSKWRVETTNLNNWDFEKKKRKERAGEKRNYRTRIRPTRHDDKNHTYKKTNAKPCTLHYYSQQQLQRKRQRYNCQLYIHTCALWLCWYFLFYTCAKRILLQVRCGLVCRYTWVLTHLAALQDFCTEQTFDLSINSRARTYASRSCVQARTCTCRPIMSDCSALLQLDDWSKALLAV